MSASRAVSARRSFVLLQFLLVAALLVVLSAGATSITGDNVLVNGDAEASPGVAPIDNSGVAPPDGWRVTGSFTAIKYGGSGGYLLPGQGPLDGGDNYFTGGPGSGIATARQIVNVSADAAVIDTGRATATISAWLGGWSTQEDAMTAQAIFRNAAGKATKGLKIGPVTAAQRGGVSKLLRRSARTQVTPGTRSIAVELVSTRSAGFFNDGAADDVSLVLAATKALGRLDLILFKKHYWPAAKFRPYCLDVDECVIASGTLLTICNKDDFKHQPFALASGNQFGTKYFGKVILRPGQCFKKRIVNTGAKTIQVKLYDEIHSQERFVLTVLPAQTG